MGAIVVTLLNFLCWFLKWIGCITVNSRTSTPLKLRSSGATAFSIIRALVKQTACIHTAGKCNKTPETHKDQASFKRWRLKYPSSRMIASKENWIYSLQLHWDFMCIQKNPVHWKVNSTGVCLRSAKVASWRVQTILKASQIEILNQLFTAPVDKFR
jgi:hypothetical protein